MRDVDVRPNQLHLDVTLKKKRFELENITQSKEKNPWIQPKIKELPHSIF